MPKALGDLYQAPASKAKKYGSGMPKIKRRLPPIPTSAFRFKAGTFRADYSDLRSYVFNSYIRLLSDRTGAVQDFDLVDVQRRMDGEATAMLFRGVDKPELQIHISF